MSGPCGRFQGTKQIWSHGTTSAGWSIGDTARSYQWYVFATADATFSSQSSVSPNGMLFVKETVRKGLLGRMLTELLDTRVMVKQAMKGVEDDKVSLFLSLRRGLTKSPVPS